MLEHEITKQDNAVVEYFCKAFEKAPRYPMNEEDAKTLMQLLMSKGKIEMPEDKKPFLVKVIDARDKGCFTYKMDDIRVQLFIAMIAESPGTAVMYLTYIQYWCKKHFCKQVDLEIFCEIFPMGFPSKDDLQKIWDGQRVRRSGASGSDNLLDYQSAMGSIQFKETAQV